MDYNKPKRSYKKKTPKKVEETAVEVIETVSEEVVEAPAEIDHTKEEVLVNVGDITKCGRKVNAVLDDGRLLISDRSGAKVVNKDDIEIV
jgi:hypothetical protein